MTAAPHNLQHRRVAMAILLASLLLTALFLAQGTTGLIAAKFFALDPTLLAAAAATPTAPTVERRRNPGAEALLSRNIFTNESLTANAADAALSLTAEAFDPSAPLTTCSGGLRLVGAIVNEKQPEWSFAAMGTGAAGGVLLYRAGSTISGHQLVAINWKRVVMASSSSYCEVPMFDPVTTAAGAPAAAAAPTLTPRATDRRRATRGADGFDSAELDSGITRVSDTQFTLQRSFVDKVLSNQAEIMRSARVVPHQEGGATAGLKVYGIRRNSLLGRLGVQNGDMLRTINGFDMTSPDSALEAYSNLRGADRLTVSLVRRGQPLTLDYNIQ